MPYLSKIRVVSSDNKLKIDTNGKDFVIRKIGLNSVDITPDQFQEQNMINNLLCADSGWTHEDLQTYDSKYKSGSKITHPFFGDGITFIVLISVF